MDWILVCFLPHPENICHWRSSVTIKNIIFSETFYCFELESRFTQKTPPGGWKLFINIFWSAVRDREIWITWEICVRRHTAAAQQLYICMFAELLIFVYLYQYTLCISVPSWAANKSPAPASPSQHSPAIKRLIFLRHETMCRRLMGSYTSITYHSTMRRLHLYSFFLNTYIIGHLLELSTKYCDIFRECYFLWHHIELSSRQNFCLRREIRCPRMKILE